MSLDVMLYIPTLWGDYEVYSANITHNLNKMADAAGVYKPVWRPEESNIERAGSLISPITKGLRVLRANPPRFIALEPANKWGTYRDFVCFLEAYLRACVANPRAWVTVSR